MPPPESLEAEIARLEQQISDILSVRQGTVGPLPTEGRYSLEALEEAYRSLNNARQRQLSVLLTSINESSNRLEGATRNLQQSSESQVKVAESHVKVAESQARAVDDLLRSSHRLEQFTIFLLVIGAINIFIIEETTGLLNGPYRDVDIVAFVIAILGLTWIGFRWVRAIRKNPNVLIP
jgi:hypothetical protein